MGKKSNKISIRWIRETRNDFRAFLDETDFPDPERLGERGPKFKYPEWLIMFIAILSVKLKIKTQLRERLKKIRHFPGKPAAFIFQLFPELE
jgi:hypothetical protein